MKSHPVLFAVLAAAVLHSPLEAAVPGGSFPWRTLQAEDAATNAELIGPSRKAGTFAAECVGRRGVRLNRTADYVEFTAPEHANSNVVRYAVPDAPEGHGINCTLSLYIDGIFRTSLAMTSRHSWLYGKESAPTNNPADLRLPGGTSFHFFDELRLLIGEIPPGAKVRLQKDSGDTADYYVIDLIDLELAPPPLPQPAGSLSVRDFGAKGDGAADDTEAIQRCLDAGVREKKAIYLPPGRYRTTRGFRVESVTVQGAGMWYSTIFNRREDLNRKSAGVGFGVLGTSVFKDFAIYGDGTCRKDEEFAFWGTWGDGSVVENVWIEKTQVGLWSGRDNQPVSKNLTVRNCRFRNVFADGINLCTGTRNAIVENCHARGTGDDAFAMWSAPRGLAPCTGNIFRNCTAEAPWRARCFSIFGGVDNRIENCLGRDTLVDSGLNLSSQFNAYPFGGTTVVKNLRLERCGGWFWGNRPYGGIFLHAATRDITGDILLEELAVVDSSAAGITISNGEKRLQNITLRNSRFDGVGEFGIDVFPQAFGEIRLENCSFSLQGKPFLRQRSPKTFLISQIGVLQEKERK